MNKPPDNIGHAAFVAYHGSAGSMPGPWTPALAQHWQAAAAATVEETGRQFFKLTTRRKP